MNRAFGTLLLCGIALSSSAESEQQISNLGLGLISEDLVLKLDECVIEGEKTGNYKACDATRFYYAALKKLMTERDLSSMSATDRILIEKRLGIIEALQIKGDEIKQ